MGAWATSWDITLPGRQLGSLPPPLLEAGWKEREAARPPLLLRGLLGWTVPPSIRASLHCQFSHVGFLEAGQWREASGPSAGPPASHPSPRGNLALAHTSANYWTLPSLPFLVPRSGRP